jgi:hypothetical protein
MIFGFGILATALLLSAVAAYYSVAGLTAIFSAATIPVIIMGGSLELGKIVATVWLHNNWRRAGIVFKMYLIPAVAFLMLLTSMGIFGYLSKAHSDQSLVSGDVTSKIAIYDEKIKTARENIEANRKQLKQMDEAVDQVMARSQDEKGAEKAVSIRKNQSRDRVSLAKDIEASQKLIATLNDESAPIRAEVRKVEAEVGPIKYIAALLYGDNPDNNLLERAVRWMIIMIVLVFDPLALTLILAANKQFEWVRQGTGGFVHDEPQYEPDDGALTEQQIEQIQASAEPPEDNRPWHERYPYLARPFVHFGNLKPMVAPDPAKEDQAAMAIVPPEEIPGVEIRPWTEEEIEALDSADEADKEAMRRWKMEHPDETIKSQRAKLARGHIDRLPWHDPKYTQTSFGSQFPAAPNRGDTFVKTDRMPPQLYKFNGDEWIIIDKNSTDNYTYDTAYIDHLIDKIATGEYDPDLLSDIEREQVADRLKQTNTNA